MISEGLSSGAELTSLLLDEVEGVIEREGAETIAMIIAEPVQNAGGCLQPPDGYWAGLREICDRHGILLVADEVITGFGRLGEWFGVSRFGAVPDLITTAKGLTSAYAPMGAVLVSDRVAAPLYDAEPDAAARDHIRRSSAVGCDRAEEPGAVRTRAGARQRPRARAPPRRPARRRSGSCRSSATCAGAATSGRSSSCRTVPQSRFDAAQREELLRVCLPGALIRAQLIARGDDRGDTVIQIAPPLICGRAVLDDLVGRLAEVLVMLSEHMGIPTA